FLSAVSKNDSEKAKTCLTNPDDYESLVVIAAKLGMDGEKTKKFADQYTSIKYSVESAEKSADGNKATVIVTMTVPDYSYAFAQGLGTVTNDMSDAQAMKNIIEKMADTRPETVKKAVAVVVVKNGDDWLIDYSNNLELLNAINGNILNSLHGNLAL
ncbi:MAG: hypothetical protein IJR47_04050, partial [Clostridia bacterium]|nr:hypothetical protein [Clostridia bacterium]